MMLQSEPKKFEAHSTWKVAASWTAPKLPEKPIARVGGADGRRKIELMKMTSRRFWAAVTLMSAVPGAVML